MNDKDPAFIAPDLAELPIPGTVKADATVLTVDEYGDQPKPPRSDATEAVAQHCVEVDALLMDLSRSSPSGLEGIEAKIRASLKVLREKVV